MPITSESGASSTSDMLVQTVSGTTVLKPGDSVPVPATLSANCKQLFDLVKLSWDRDLWTTIYNRIVAPDPQSEPNLARFVRVLKVVLAMDICAGGALTGDEGSIEIQKERLVTQVASDSPSLLGSSGSPGLPALIELGLQQGPLRAEVVNDRVSLSVKTETAIVTSSGKNAFGVAYDPSSGTTFVTAYQGPVSVESTNSNLAPFTLDAGQIVEVSLSGIGPITTVGQTTGSGPVGETQGGCHTDPSTGVVTCVDTIGDFSNPDGSNQGSSGQGGCYKDPMTGTITCVDFNGNPINTQGGSKTNQPGPGSSIPQSLNECETYTSEICGTWTLQGSHINAVWNNGAKATLNVEQFDNNGVVITRQDTVGSSAGLTAQYEGRLIGNHVEGSVTWNWNGATWSGTWKADW